MASYSCEGWPASPSVSLEIGQSLVYQWVSKNKIACLIKNNKSEYIVSLYQRINGAFLNSIKIGQLKKTHLSCITSNSVPVGFETEDLNVKFKPLTGEAGLQLAGPWNLGDGRVSLIKDDSYMEADRFCWLLELPNESTSWIVHYSIASYFCPNSNYRLEESRDTENSLLSRKWSRLTCQESWFLDYWAYGWKDCDNREQVLCRSRDYYPVEIGYTRQDSLKETFPSYLRFRHISPVVLSRLAIPRTDITHARAYVHSEESTITLVNSDPNHWHGHALILIERIGPKGYEMWKTHLVGNKGCREVSDGHVRLDKIEDPDAYIRDKVVAQSETWVRNTHLVNKLFNEVRSEISSQLEHPVVRFHAFGEDSGVPNYENDNRPVHSCITWAREKLRIVNINLEKTRIGSLITLPTEYTNPGAKIKRPSSLESLYHGIQLAGIFSMVATYMVVKSIFDAEEPGLKDKK